MHFLSKLYEQHKQGHEDRFEISEMMWLCLLLVGRNKLYWGDVNDDQVRAPTEVFRMLLEEEDYFLHLKDGIEYLEKAAQHGMFNYRQKGKLRDWAQYLKEASQYWDKQKEKYLENNNTDR